MHIVITLYRLVDRNLPSETPGLFHAISDIRTKHNQNIGDNN